MLRFLCILKKYFFICQHRHILLILLLTMDYIIHILPYLSHLIIYFRALSLSVYVQLPHFYHDNIVVQYLAPPIYLTRTPDA